MSKVVVVGASGVVGASAVDEFLDRDWEVVTISRRRPTIESERETTHLSLDLRDGDATATGLAELADVTHVVYAALYEKPGLVAGWRDSDQMRTNLSMLRNVMEPLLANNPIEHVSLLQGAKAYGTHIHTIPVPAKEAAPRDAHENFYWLQEDWIRDAAQRHGFAWTILRPQLIVGGAVGVAMNVAPVIGVYAAVCRELGLPFSYPGGASYVWETVDARICATALSWAADAPTARNETFNLTNGDVFEWRHLWPTLAEVLEVDQGPDESRELATFLPENAATWKRVADKHDLRISDIGALIGESHFYADRCFAYGREEPYDPRFLSTVKIRQAGYADARDTSETFSHWLRVLQRRRYLPGPR